MITQGRAVAQRNAQQAYQARDAFPKDRIFLFHMTDPDALNAVLEVSSALLAVVGQEGMAFIPGLYELSHAQGRPKPWEGAFIRQAMRGLPPTMPDKKYWANLERPLRLFPPSTLRFTRLGDPHRLGHRPRLAADLSRYPPR